MPSHLTASSPARCWVVRPPGNLDRRQSFTIWLIVCFAAPQLYKMGLVSSVMVSSVTFIIGICNMLFSLVFSFRAGHRCHRLPACAQMIRCLFVCLFVFQDWQPIAQYSNYSFGIWTLIWRNQYSCNKITIMGIKSPSSLEKMCWLQCWRKAVGTIMSKLGKG